MARTKGRSPMQSCAPRRERPWPWPLLGTADARAAPGRGLTGDSDGADSITAEGWPGAWPRAPPIYADAKLGPRLLFGTSPALVRRAVRPMGSLRRERADNVFRIEIERES